jgi:hypothetical protein
MDVKTKKTSTLKKLVKSVVKPVVTGLATRKITGNNAISKKDVLAAAIGSGSSKATIAKVLAAGKKVGTTNSSSKKPVVDSTKKIDDTMKDIDKNPIYNDHQMAAKKMVDDLAKKNAAKNTTSPSVDTDNDEDDDDKSVS